MIRKTLAVLLVSACIFSCQKNTNTKDESVTALATQPVDEKAVASVENIPVANETTFGDSAVSAQAPTPSPANPLPRQALPVPVKTDWDQKIIKTANVNLEVKNMKEFNARLRNQIRQYGGYIAEEDNTVSEERTEDKMVVKVPVQYFEGLMNEISNGDEKLLERSIRSEDVTGQAADTRARLVAKKMVRLKYMEFLQHSKNTEEMLQVQNEINSIQEEIESATGRFAALTHQAAFSTINLHFFQTLEGAPATDKDPSFLTRVTSAFSIGGTWLSNVFVAMVAIWPLMLLAFAAWAMWRRRKPVVILSGK